MFLLTYPSRRSCASPGAPGDIQGYCDRYGIEMYYMSESGYFLNFVMGCPFQSTADIFVILLCLPDLAFLLPFLSFHIYS